LKSSQISFFIETLGCPKNKVDSRVMRFALLRSGFMEAKNSRDANYHLINSCSFIREAQEETVDTVFHAIEEKKDNIKKVGLIGCFAERFPKALKEEIPEIDFSVGTGNFDKIPTILAQKYGIELEQHAAIKWADLQNKEDSYLPYSHFRIATGCSRSCEFCILPSIRGSLTKLDIPQMEKSWQDEKELRNQREIKEVILVSQDTISQGVEELEKIIEYYSNKEEIKWIRLQYLFPDKRVLKLLDLYERYPKLVSYLDIPFQHVSQNILKDMNRPYDKELFVEIIDKARSIRPNIEVRTSFIVGFPSESENDFIQLRDFISKNNIEKIALFRYSHEEGTSAAIRVDDVNDELKVSRINELRDFHLQNRSTNRNSLIDNIETMLVDTVNDLEIITRRQQDSPEIDEVVFIDKPHTKSDVVAGDFVKVKINQPMEYDYMGEIVEK